MSFICPAIQTYIDQTAFQTFHKEKKSPFPIDLYVKLDPLIIEKTNPNLILEYMEFCVDYIASLRWSSPIDYLSVTIEFSPAKKVWCGGEIDKCNINSGETDFQGKKRYIRIWRREDYHKVLLHELLHAFNWDRLVQSENPRESEAMIEALAVLFHCWILGGDQNQELLEKERRWFTKQLYWLKTRKWSTKDTNVSEYIILKSALLLTPALLSRFWSWICSDSEAECRKGWNKLVLVNMKELNEVQKQSSFFFPEGECVSLKLVTTQLSLSPFAK